MFDIVRLRDFDKFSLIDPPDLPDPVYCRRLRDALRFYRARKGARVGWSWIIKNEIWKCLTEEEKKHPTCQPYLHLDTIRGRLERWLPKLDAKSATPRLVDSGSHNGSEIRDPRLVLLAERLLHKFAPDLLEMSLPGEQFLAQGRALARFLSAPRRQHQAMDWRRAARLQRGFGEPLLSPGKYKLDFPDYALIADYVLPQYLSIIDVGEKEFYKAVWLSFQSEGPTPILGNRSIGYLFKYSDSPILMVRCPGGSGVLIRQMERIDPKKFDLPSSYVTTLMSDTFMTRLSVLFAKMRWITDDIYTAPTSNTAIISIIDSISQEFYNERDI